MLTLSRTFSAVHQGCKAKVLPGENVAESPIIHFNSFYRQKDGSQKRGAEAIGIHLPHRPISIHPGTPQIR